MSESPQNERRNKVSLDNLESERQPIYGQDEPDEGEWQTVDGDFEGERHSVKDDLEPMIRDTLKECLPGILKDWSEGQAKEKGGTGKATLVNRDRDGTNSFEATLRDYYGKAEQEGYVADSPTTGRLGYQRGYPHYPSNSERFYDQGNKDYGVSHRSGYQRDYAEDIPLPEYSATPHFRGMSSNYNPSRQRRVNGGTFGKGYQNSPSYSRQTNYGGGRNGNSNFFSDHNREDLSVKVRSYCPKETDWFTYKTHFEAIAGQAGWSSKTRCIKLMSALQGNLTGITAGMKHPVSYEQLVSRLDQVHGVSSDREDAFMKLNGCRKGQNEPMSMFGERVRQLTERAYPSYSPQDKDEQALRVFLNGLSSKHDVRMQMKLKDFKSLREAVTYGAKLEQVLVSETVIDGRHGLTRSATHFEPKDDMAFLIEQVCKQVIAHQNGLKTNLSEMKGQKDTGKDRRTPQNSPCHICNELGHWARDCPQKKETSDSNSRRIPLLGK